MRAAACLCRSILRGTEKSVPRSDRAYKAPGDPGKQYQRLATATVVVTAATAAEQEQDDQHAADYEADVTTEEIEETVRKAQEKAEWSAFDFSSKVLAVNYALETATFQKLDFEAGCASVTISSEKRLLLKKEVQDYADYLIRKLIEEALKNGSDREAKE